VILYDLLKRPFFARYRKPWQWPSGVPQDSWERVEFRNRSGVRMVGLLGRARTMPARARILMPHPMHPDAKAYVLRAEHPEMLRAAGYDVFLFDFNGFGESDNGNFLYPLDIVSAGETAARLSPDLPIALYGISLGAGYGICALDTPGHPFRVAILESPFTTLEEYWRKFPGAYFFLKALTVLMPGVARQLRPIARMRTITGVDRLFMIYPGNDSVTPPEMGERLMAACPLPEDRRSLWVLPEGKHTRAIAAAPDEYRRRVLQFLDAAFGGVSV